MNVEAQNLQAGQKIWYMGEQWVVQTVAEVTGSDSTCRVRAENLEKPQTYRSWVISKTRMFTVPLSIPDLPDFVIPPDFP